MPPYRSKRSGDRYMPHHGSHVGSTCSLTWATIPPRMVCQTATCPPPFHRPLRCGPFFVPMHAWSSLLSHACMRPLLVPMHAWSSLLSHACMRPLLVPMHACILHTVSFVASPASLSPTCRVRCGLAAATCTPRCPSHACSCRGKYRYTLWDTPCHGHWRPIGRGRPSIFKRDQLKDGRHSPSDRCVVFTPRPRPSDRDLTGPSTTVPAEPYPETRFPAGSSGIRTPRMRYVYIRAIRGRGSPAVQLAPSSDFPFVSAPYCQLFGTRRRNAVLSIGGSAEPQP